jgi:23S rRNA pseudouridine1911/1915/1917 synthase
LPSEIISTTAEEDRLAQALAGEASEVTDEVTEQPETRVCEIPAEMHGWRVDRALAGLIPEFSRSYLQQLMTDGAVQLRGETLRKAATRLTAGTQLQVELRPTQQAMSFVAQAMDLTVVYEDADLLVINKPAGLVVHPAAGHWSGTLLNGLLAHHTGAAALPRAGIVHRLDKDTSGLMLVGKSRQAVEALVRAIAARDVHREYIALAQGRWTDKPEVEVDQPIGRDARNRLRMAVVSLDTSTGKTARTTVRVLQGHDQATLVACKLHTGRTHQIRVHMAWLGHPLVGDTLYGGRVQWDMTRQALHAARLRLLHPISGKPLDFRCPLPTDFLGALEQAGLHYNGSSPG